MKRAVAIAMLLSLFAGCSAEIVERPPRPPIDWQSLVPKPPPAPQGSLSALDHEKLVGDLYMKSLDSPRFAGMVNLLGDEAHFCYAGYQDEYGRDRIVAAHQALFGAFAPRHFVTGRAFITDGSQAREWVMTGTDKASGKPVSIAGITILSTNYDDSLADVRVYFDQALVQAQLGPSPKELAGFVPPQLPAKTEEFKQTGSPDEKANVTAVSAWFDALENKKESAFIDAISEDVEVRTQQSAAPTFGREAIRSYYETMHTEIADLDTTIDNSYGVGDFVIVEYHIVGEQKESISWIPVQKEPALKMYIVSVMQMKGGKIASIWRYDNPGQIIDTP